MNILEEIYQNLVISSFGKIEATKFSKLLGKGYSHDRFTKQLLLDGNLESDEKLWKTIKPFLRDYENEQSGCIVIDDMLMDKSWTKVNDIVFNAKIPFSFNVFRIIFLFFNTLTFLNCV